MAVEVLMPKQGNSVESCIILDWRKQEGDSIAVGDILCEAETDKSTIEVESTASGVVLRLLYAVGDEVPVQKPIAVIGAVGEKAASPLKVSAEGTGPVAMVMGSVIGDSSQTVPTASAREPGLQAVSPRARIKALDEGLDATVLVGSGPKGRVIERDVAKALESREPISPAAREVLAKGGLEAPIKGSGIGGRVLVADLSTPSTETVKETVAVTVEPTQSIATGAAAPGSLEFPGATVVVPVKSIRKVIAKRMHESLASTAQLTMNAFADATALKALRAKFKNSAAGLGLQKITINDLVLFAVARTLGSFSYMNSHYLGDRIVAFEHVHLGCAVDTPKGLLVPVVRFADLMSLSQISRTFKSLSASAIEGKATSEDLGGSTFTVTNLGTYGIETFTPVINLPEVAILGVDGINLRPMENEDGEISFVPHIGLSLTIDHQAVDGAPAARFLKALCDNIAAIDLMLAL
ncbi:MAG: dihydrolipoamide acetyltransferase family protein [Sphaerochaetaceae bacterium]